MWQHLLALPLVARIVALTAAGLLALWGAIKAKAIHAAVKKATDKATTWFWGWLGAKILPHTPQKNSGERTYKGTFQEYRYTSVPRATHLFTIVHEGVATTVPVLDTALFIPIKRGALIEIDTEALPGYEAELVKRVHVLQGPIIAGDDATLRAEQDVEAEIREMTQKEREIISCLLHRNQRVFTNTIDGGYVTTLISKGIVVNAARPGQVFRQHEFPFEIPRPVWEVLMRHKASFPYSGEDDDEPWRVPWMLR
jgi:hypothetical protein